MATLETDAAPEPSFNAFLLKIASYLTTDDLNALKYMFKDLITQNKRDRITDDAIGIFTVLCEKRLIQQGKTLLLSQAFRMIGRNDILADLLQIGPDEAVHDQDRAFPDGTVSPFRLALFEVAQNVTPDEVERAKFYFGDIIGKQKRGKIKNAFDLLNVLEQLKPTDIILELKKFLNEIERMDILEDFLDHNGITCNSPNDKPRRSTQEEHQSLDTGYASATPKSGGAAPNGPDAKKAISNKPFPGSLGKANQDMDIEKAIDMSLLSEAATSVCSIGTNGTGFMVGNGCIMTAAHVLNDSLGITDEDMQRLMKEPPETRSMVYKSAVQTLLVKNLSVHFTHGDCIPRPFRVKDMRYVNLELDTAVLELEPSKYRIPFPQPFKSFLPDFKGTFNIIGHLGDLTLYREHSCRTITEVSDFLEKKKELLKRKIPPECLNVYDTFGEDPSFLQFQCSLQKGASGSPGVVVQKGQVYVFTMLLAGFPVVNPDKISLDPKLCVEQGVTMKAVYDHMKEADQQLHYEIFGTN